MVDSRLTYIHENPVRAGWVDKEDEYLYSSASNYTGLPAFIAVDWIGRCSKIHPEWRMCDLTMCMWQKLTNFLMDPDFLSPQCLCSLVVKHILKPL